MPERSKRSITRGEWLAGPMVHTIFECRKAIIYHAEKKLALPLRRMWETVSGYLLLLGDRELRDDMGQNFHALIE